MSEIISVVAMFSLISGYMLWLIVAMFKRADKQYEYTFKLQVKVSSLKKSVLGKQRLIDVLKQQTIEDDETIRALENKLMRYQGNDPTFEAAKVFFKSQVELPDDVKQVLDENSWGLYDGCSE